MAHQSGRARGMGSKRPARGDRKQRSGPPDQDRDIQTEIEDAMDASGRTSTVPPEGLVGAHRERRSRANDVRDPDDRLKEPTGPGADVAPTRKAELREARRHQLEAQLGHVPAGERKAIRQRRSQFATREALDGVAAEADQAIARRHVNAEGQLTPLPARAWSWLNTHRSEVAIGVGGFVFAVGCWSAVNLLRRPR
jgi:hypothetical protein